MAQAAPTCAEAMAAKADASITPIMDIRSAPGVVSSRTCENVAQYSTLMTIYFHKTLILIRYMDNSII